jgi:YVTN family beta-propeller protein
VNNSGDDTVTVIDTTKNTVKKTLSVGKNPFSMTQSGNILFVVNKDSNSISVIDTLTDEVVKTLSTGIAPLFAIVENGMLYSLDSKSNSVTSFDINIPQLLELNTTAATGEYNQGASLTIRASFDTLLSPKSSMRLTLNTNKTVTLDTIEGKHLTGIYTI